MTVRSSRLRAALVTLSSSWVNLAIVSLQAVVLVPLYLRHIGPRLYGAWLGSGDFLIWMQTMDLGLPNLMIQRIGAAQGRGEIDSVVEYFSSGLLALSCLAIVLMVVFSGISIWLPGWMQLDGREALEIRASFLIGVFATGLLIVTNSAVGLARGIQDTVLINATVILSSIVGFLVTLGLLVSGMGLLSIAIGLLVRAAVSLVGSTIFVVGYFRQFEIWSLRIRLSVLSEYLKMLPITGAAGLSYALMNQSEAALIAIFIRPEVATIFTLSRKAIAVARNLVDGIGTAVYGSFAHLVASEDKHRAGPTFAEINALRLSLSVAFASAYMIVNHSLVSLWVGRQQYGGAVLTILLGLRFIANGSSYLVNYLYRAMGEIVRGSLLLLAEGMVRFGLTLGILVVFGFQGMPLAGILTGFVFGSVTYRLAVKRLSGFSNLANSSNISVWFTRLAMVCVGVVGACFNLRLSWGYIFGIGTGVVMVGCGALVFSDSRLAVTQAAINTAVSRLATIISE